MDALRDERGCAIQRLVEEELSALHDHGKVLHMRDFEIVDEFVQLFAGPPRFRRPILAIVGGTNLGKSMLAAHVLNKVAEVLTIPAASIEQAGDDTPFLEVTVEDSMQLDLSDFDVSMHAGVLLDGVGDTLFLKQNREALQGRPKVCKGGKSGTMMYAYPYTLCRRAVVAIFDLSAANLRLLHTDHWLSDRRNIFVLRLSAPAWVAGETEPAVPPSQPPRMQMASWGVDQLAEFLALRDLCGPAEAMRASGVAGVDFLAWNSAGEVQVDVRLTPFAARKVLAARDEFLAS